MKKILLFVILTSIKSYSYYAEIRPINKPNDPVLYKIEFNEKQNGNLVELTATFKKDDQIQIEEKGIVNPETAEFTQYSVNQIQTKEKGLVTVQNNQVKISFDSLGKSTQTKEFSKPNQLVAPANFDRWLKKNFENLKKQKTMTIQFLVWDRLDYYNFKVTYLGLFEVDKTKVHRFKMNVDNFLISAFVSDIEIEMSEDLNQLKHYKGRVAVKIKKGDQFKDLDADVKYFYN